MHDSDEAVVRRVGVVGTGEMGRPLIDRLLAHGFAVTAFARRAEARAELAEAGVDLAADLAALGPGCDVVIVYVFSDDQVRDVAERDGLLASMDPGAVLVVHTTCHPDTVRSLADAARERGVGVVDAAGSGGPAKVAAGELVLMVGGAVEHLARCRPVLASYASEIHHLGDVGTGQRAKLVNNLLFGAQTELAIEAARIAESFGIDPVVLARTLHNCSGASAALDLVPLMGSADALLRGAGWTIFKDVQYVIRLMDELDTPLGSFEGVIGAALRRTEAHQRHH